MLAALARVGRLLGCARLRRLGGDRKSDEKLVGNAGLFNAWRGLDPEFGEEPGMGWIFEEVHGQGMAGEACRAVLQWAEAESRANADLGDHRPGQRTVIKAGRQLGFEHCLRR